ncbi:unnamed protein product [Vitrella brassicaformis CCMP3155]|uniref:Uncharacterized protein n=1 Tax=Vitrella brassicaformis (strain CCMP3155) TaxID=1169540 RepID=A0A0G4E890_VITBC|nr:unnamed protein product [Vitrella brassicaformis CCMP3155]|mmetsp:Transcript_34076/g.84283  ORF Transcript_34076/g.84283 Transcript_34076/m.84283 type:complete len:110 (-) Transcript_34076:129-458(-)|eukprot:CEL91840.1 unnamed protein product [Vitrella brassicaformis CCMP3155]
MSTECGRPAGQDDLRQRQRPWQRHAEVGSAVAQGSAQHFLSSVLTALPLNIDMICRAAIETLKCGKEIGNTRDFDEHVLASHRELLGQIEAAAACSDTSNRTMRRMLEI